MRHAIPWIVVAAALALGSSAAAQTLSTDSRALQAADQAETQSEGVNYDNASTAAANVIGHETADTGIGKVGQRQGGRDAAPNGRISNRIESRVQNRLRNRIDRHYDATAGTTDPFRGAEQGARTVSLRSRPR